jgi:sulfur carrier protein ThiS adenylyltransferase
METDQFTRNVPGMTEVLGRRCIAVAGCGGLGSNAAVALVRAGIGRLILVDCDRVESSNLNRQAFDRNDLGMPKVEALARHLKDIHPGVNLVSHCQRLAPADVGPLLGDADLLIEAFDNAHDKHWLVHEWVRCFPGRPVVSGNGVAGMGRTDELKVVRAGNIWFCGDLHSSLELGLCSARVALVAAMQANVAIELLMNEETS